MSKRLCTIFKFPNIFKHLVTHCFAVCFQGTDGSTLLGLVAGLGALVLVFLLYINKKWWWGAVGGMSCCDEACPPVSARPVPSPPVPSTSMSPPLPKNKQLGRFLSQFCVVLIKCVLRYDCDLHSYQ